MAAQGDAKEEILAAIAKVAKNAPQFQAPAASAALRDLAIAYRAILGGSQPDGVRFPE